MKFYFNADDPLEIARHCNQVRALQGTGKYHGTIDKYRATRSQQQNRAYHGMIVPVFADYLTEQWGHEHTRDDAHYELKKAILGKEIVNPTTGEVKVVVPSTHDMDRVVFWDYVVRARELVERLTGVHIPDPDPNYRTVTVPA